MCTPFFFHTHNLINSTKKILKCLGMLSFQTYLAIWKATMFEGRMVSHSFVPVFFSYVLCLCYGFR